jgi:hypothetical protein
VIDMKRLERDFQLNSINDRTFVCLDRKFFKNGYSINEPSTNGRRDGLGESQEEEKKGLSQIEYGRRHLRREVVEDDDLGFCFGDDDNDKGGSAACEEEEVEAVLTKAINLDNKFVKEDLEKLSEMCSAIVSSRKNSESQLKLDSSASIGSTPRSNKFLKVISPAPLAQQERNPFLRFSGPLKGIIAEEDCEEEAPVKKGQQTLVVQSSPAKPTTRSGTASGAKKRKLDEVSGLKPTRIDNFFGKNSDKKRRLNNE